MTRRGLSVVLLLSMLIAVSGQPRMPQMPELPTGGPGGGDMFNTMQMPGQQQQQQQQQQGRTHYTSMLLLDTGSRVLCDS